MRNKIDESSISNELTSQSIFFKGEKRSNVRTVERSESQISEAETDRQIIRHTFDIFQDQLQSLHSLQLKAIQKGKKKPKLGQMVREAIDAYLANE